MASEAAPVEELALSTDALQHIDPLTTEVTLLTVRHRHASTRLGLGLGRWIRSGIRCRTELSGRRRHHRLRERVKAGKIQ